MPEVRGDDWLQRGNQPNDLRVLRIPGRARSLNRLGHAAEEFEFTVETVQRSQQGWGEERKEMACQRCGGVVSVPPDAVAYSCSFCGSNKVIYRAALEDVLRPHSLIPFQIDPQYLPGDH